MAQSAAGTQTDPATMTGKELVTAIRELEREYIPSDVLSQLKPFWDALTAHVGGSGDGGDGGRQQF